MYFTVDVHIAAQDDIDRIVGRITRTVSPASAAKWNDSIRARIRTLAKNPEMWPEADEASSVGLDLRVLLFGRYRHKKYRILFTIDGDIVNVLRVRHAAQDYLTQDDL